MKLAKHKWSVAIRTGKTEVASACENCGTPKNKNNTNEECSK